MGASALKRHRQLGLFNARGGKADQRRGRARGGRPRKTPRGSAPHRKRALDVRSTWPVHVVLRVVQDVVGLRKRSIYKALRAASLSALRQHDDSVDGPAAARIIHVSIQQSHIHLIVEAPSQEALSKGMQGFKISAAKHINRVLSAERGERRRGAVFSERYFAEVIRTPRQARNTLAYVLNNWRKHDEDKRSVARGWRIDPFFHRVRVSGLERAHRQGDFVPRARDIRFTAGLEATVVALTGGLATVRRDRVPRGSTLARPNMAGAARAPRDTQGPCARS